MTKEKSKRLFLCGGCRCADSFDPEEKSVFCKIAGKKISAVEYLAGMKFEDCDWRRKPSTDPSAPEHLVELARIARRMGTADLRVLPIN